MKVALAVGTMCAVAMATAGAAAAVDAPRGTFSATVSGLKPAGLNGRWTISFTAPYKSRPSLGGYTLVHGGTTVARGSYHLQYTGPGLLLQLRDFGGKAPCAETNLGGNYYVRASGKTLRLVPSPVVDTCAKRLKVVTSQLFARTS
jgi:hypothetical protein